MNYYYSILIVFFSLWLSACGTSSPSHQTTETYGFRKINCYVRYMAVNRELQAEMTFRTDSTIAIEGAVSCNDKPLQFRKLPQVGFQYRNITNGVNFDYDYTFRYIEKSGQPVELDVSLEKFDDFKIATENVSKTKGGLITWEGSPMTKEDGMVLVFTDEKGTSLSINHVGNSKGATFDILPQHIQSLSEGKATLQVTRKRTIVRQNKGCTELLTIEYYLPIISFDIKA